MLNVFKRRWKPKRSANVSRIPDSNSLDGSDKSSRQSIRQVHPVTDDKTQLLMPELSTPPPYPKRASLDSNPSPTQCYPLAPNICVEAGRIQFIRQETEGVQDLPDGLPTPPVTVTRGQQTEELDDAKKSLELKIHELEIALHAAHKNELRDKLTISKLQKQIARVLFIMLASLLRLSMR